MENSIEKNKIEKSSTENIKENIYHELEVKSTNALELFKNFSFELGISAVEEIENGFIIRDNESLENLKFALNEYKNALENSLKTKIDLSLNLSQKQNRDWIDEYKKGVKPILVGEIYIRPSWEKALDERLNIIIDPALAFGSGHHESTNLCLNLLQKYKNGYKTALDVGCGSGILSIALAKLGLSVSACDTDILAVESSKENAIKNEVVFSEIWQGSADGAVANSKKYDIVVANIIADIIFIIKNDLIKSVESGGILVLSGILEKYLDRVKTEFKALNLLEISKDGEWVSFVFKKERN